MQSAWLALGLSLKVAGCATLVNLLLGVSLAYALARGRFVGRELVDAVCTLPMVLPPTVLGYYLLVVLGRQGPLGGWLYHEFGISLIFTWQAAVIAASVVTFPLVLRPARVAFESVNPELEQAAQVLGVSNSSVFWRVSLPLAWRGILAGLLLGFTRALGEFGATLMVAGSIPGESETLSVAVYQAVQAGRDDLAMFLVLVTSALSLLVLLTVGRLSGNHSGY